MIGSSPAPLVGSELTSTPFQGGSSLFQAMAQRVLDGESIDRSDALAILQSSDLELMDVLSASYKVRHRHFGNTVQFYFLVNAKSGLCPEDCHYCSQSKIAETTIPRYRMLTVDQLLDGARVAKAQDAKTYCIVISARSPNEKELKTVEEVVPRIKQEYGLKVCACLGLLTEEHARRLKACGVDRVNHNLNTSSRFYPSICTTHTYEDRLQTLQHVRQAGIELCSGGIIGMGERDEDVVEMAFALRELQTESIPLNFLYSIDGTPLENERRLTPQQCLRALAMFRMVNPTSELRIAGGREIHLRSLQPLGLYPANSVFVGDYLTTKGQAPESDYQMVRDLGFEVTFSGEAGGRIGNKTTAETT
jgi:biotin synthase